MTDTLYRFERYRLMQFMKKVEGSDEEYQRYCKDRQRVAQLVAKHYRELGTDGGEIVARFWLYRGEEEEMAKKLYNPANINVLDVYETKMPKDAEKHFPKGREPRWKKLAGRIRR